jgi:hypothetical protein
MSLLLDDKKNILSSNVVSAQTAKITGDLTVQGDTIVGGNATVNGDATVEGTTTFEDDVVMPGNASQIRIGVPDALVPTLAETRMYVANTDTTVSGTSGIFQIAPASGMPAPPAPYSITNYHLAIGSADPSKFHRIRSSGGDNLSMAIDCRDFKCGIDMQYTAARMVLYAFSTTGGRVIVASTGGTVCTSNDDPTDGNADPSAQLEVRSTTKGFLPPRMTGAEAGAIASPKNGLMVYVTDSTGGLSGPGWF